MEFDNGINNIEYEFASLMPAMVYFFHYTCQRDTCDGMSSFGEHCNIILF